MSNDKSALEKMLKENIRSVTDDELKKLIEAELSKPEDEIDTEYVDLCFELMNVNCAENKRIVFTKPVKLALLSAAIIILMVSGISALADNPKSPIKLLPNNKTEVETTTEEETTEATTRSNNYYYYYNQSPDKSESATVSVPNFCNGEFFAENFEEGGVYSGLNVTINYGYSAEEVPIGIIYEQSIAPGTEVAEGTEIILTANMENDEITVPSLTGLTMAEIQSLAESSELTFTYTCEDGTNNYGERVISQNPAPGTVVPRGTSVLVTFEAQPREDEIRQN